ncbi:MAG: helix-turn-helix domain-containing protein [Sediminibacterium sp.]
MTNTQITSATKQLSMRLNHLMEECGIDGVQLGKNTGVPVTTINRLRNGAYECNPTLSTLIPLAEYFRITLSQLVGDEPLPANREPGEHQPKVVDWQEIPLLTFDQAAAWPRNKASIMPAISRKISTDLDLSDYAFALLMEGDSMSPRFPEGTLLLIDPNQQIHHRDFVLLLQIGLSRPIFKQILLDGPDYYIKSLNEDFKEVKKISLADYKLLGVMVQARMERKP